MGASYCLLALGVLKLAPQIDSLQSFTERENGEHSILETFSVKYIPDPKNIADSLSRLLHPTSNSKEKSHTDEYVKWVVQESIPIALTTREIESASENVAIVLENACFTSQMSQ